MPREKIDAEFARRGEKNDEFEYPVSYLSAEDLRTLKMIREATSEICSAFRTLAESTPRNEAFLLLWEAFIYFTDWEANLVQKAFLYAGADMIDISNENTVEAKR